MAPIAPSPLSGRRAQAARNDTRILESARSVFLADPSAPITAVAKHAGVGISALYTRYGSKEELLRKLCHDGLRLFVEETEAALGDDRDDWTMFTTYMKRLVDADTTSMTLALAGKFSPTEEMFALAEHANELMGSLFERVKHELRPDADVHDLSLILELVAALKVSDRARTERLRRRYLVVILDGMRAREGQEPRKGQQPHEGQGPREYQEPREHQQLPGPPPSWRELNERWVARDAAS